MNEEGMGRTGAPGHLHCRGVAAGLRWRIGAAITNLVLVGLLAGCASTGDERALAVNSGGSGGVDIPDAVPRVEPLSKSGNPDSYQIRGKRYFTKKTSTGHVERGLASWYGKQFHGRKTSSGERYNMYAMTAAHKTLPLPSYVRVTNMENGRTAVVKVNDRGPFHGPRVIDLSYSAAKKLGVIQKGTAMVEVRAIDASRPSEDKGPFVAARGAAKGKQSPASVAARGEPSSPSAPSRSPAAAAPSSGAQGGESVKERALDSALAAVAARPVEQPAEPSVRPATEPVEKVPESASGGSKEGLYLQAGAFGDPRNAERLRQHLVANLSEQVRIQRSATGEAALYKVRIGPLNSDGEASAVSAKLVTLGVDQPRRVWN